LTCTSLNGSHDHADVGKELTPAVAVGLCTSAPLRSLNEHDFLYLGKKVQVREHKQEEFQRESKKQAPH